MKKSTLLPGAAFGCAFLGLITWALRWRLLTTAVDEKGLLAAGHPLSAACWIITALAALLTVLCFREEPKTVRLAGGAVSGVLRALAMIVACVLFWNSDFLGKTAALAAVVTAAVSLGSLVIKKIPAAVLDIPMLVFFLLCLLSRYQAWSAEPEIQRYCFSLLALVFLMMATYQRSAVSLGMAKGRMLLCSGCLGVFFAFAAATDRGFAVLFLVLGAWMLTELASVNTEA